VTAILLHLNQAKGPEVMKRHKMGGKSSKKLFSRTASMTHKKNLPGARTVMRGGIRL